MGLRDRFERALGLGTSDEPRAHAVEASRRVVVRPVVSTPGARVRLSRDGTDGELGRVLLMCHRRGVPVELVDGPNGLWLDGVEVAPMELRSRLGDTR
ncbi:MAG: hypothetical protein Q8P41_02605 [Pseudomonadota bacterium]|nr:hypothetical protein [Pseudomonadota bacterium]